MSFVNFLKLWNSRYKPLLTGDNSQEASESTRFDLGPGQSKAKTLKRQAKSKRLSYLLGEQFEKRELESTNYYQTRSDEPGRRNRSYGPTRPISPPGSPGFFLGHSRSGNERWCSRSPPRTRWMRTTCTRPARSTNCDGNSNRPRTGRQWCCYRHSSSAPPYGASVVAVAVWRTCRRTRPGWTWWRTSRERL